MARLNVYIKKEHEELIEAGKKKGIGPSKALIEGYKFLMGKNSNYAVLEEKRDVLLKQLTNVENEMDKLRDEIIIDPDSQAEVLKDLARGYLNDNVIHDPVRDVRRVQLNLSMGDIKKLVKKEIIDPVNSGELTKLNLESYFSTEKPKDEIDKAKAFFKRQYENEGKLNQSDVKRWAYGLNLESDKLQSILEEEFRS